MHLHTYTYIYTFTCTYKCIYTYTYACTYTYAASSPHSIPSLFIVGTDADTGDIVWQLQRLELRGGLGFKVRVMVRVRVRVRATISFRAREKGRMIPRAMTKVERQGEGWWW